MQRSCLGSVRLLTRITLRSGSALLPGGVQMRRGWTFKRCCRCGVGVKGHKCSRCGWSIFTWTFVVDIAPVGYPRQQRKTGGFATKGAAIAAMTRFLVEREEGIQIDRSSLTTGQYLTAWLSGVAAGGSIRATTAKAYDVAIRVHISPRLGRVPLAQLSRKLIKELYETLRLRGRARVPVGRGLSTKAVHNIHLTLHRALEDAVEDGLLRSNPAARAHRMGATGNEMRPWTSNELHRFLTTVEDQPNFALWRLAACTGMRCGELLGLRWRDLDLDEGLVAVQRPLLRNGDAVGFGQPKTAAGRRTICLDPTTVEVLRRHQARQAVARAESDVGSKRRPGPPESAVGGPESHANTSPDQILKV